MPHSPVPKGRLLLIGGHERRHATPEDEALPDKSADFILRRFVAELPGQRTIAVIPTASAEAEKAARDYLDCLVQLGSERVEVLDV